MVIDSGAESNAAREVFDLGSGSSSQGLSEVSQRILFVATALCSFGLMAFFAIAAIQGLGLLSGVFKTPGPPILAVGLVFFFAVVGFVLIYLATIAGERAIKVDVTDSGLAFYYPSGRDLFFPWRGPSRRISIRRYSLGVGADGQRFGIYCDAPVRALLNQSALDSILRRAAKSGLPIREWKSSFPIAQTHYELGFSGVG